MCPQVSESHASGWGPVAQLLLVNFTHFDNSHDEWVPLSAITTKQLPSFAVGAKVTTENREQQGEPAIAGVIQGIYCSPFGPTLYLIAPDNDPTDLIRRDASEITLAK